MQKTYFKIVVGDTIYFVPSDHAVNAMQSPEAPDYLLAAELVVQNHIVLKNRNDQS